LFYLWEGKVEKLRLPQPLIIVVLVALLSICLAYPNSAETLALPVSRGEASPGSSGGLIIGKRDVRVEAVQPRKIIECHQGCGSPVYFVTFKMLGKIPAEVRELQKEKWASFPPKPVKLSFHLFTKTGERVMPLEAGMYRGYIEYEGGYRIPIVWETIELSDLESVDAVVTFGIGGTLAPGYGDEYGGYTLVRVEVEVDWWPSSGPLFIGLIDHDVDPYTAYGVKVYGGSVRVTLYPPFSQYHYHTLVVGNLGDNTVSYSGHVQWQTAHKYEPASGKGG